MRYLDDGGVLVEFIDAGGNVQRVTLTAEQKDKLKEELGQEKPAAPPPPEPAEAEDDLLKEEAEHDQQYEDEPKD